MGKSFELLGLAAFNVFLAIILAITFLSDGENASSPSHLTETQIKRFVMHVNDIASGKRPDMDNYTITSFFMEHVADNGEFTNSIEYDLPRIKAQNKTMKMNKLDYIGHILQGMGAERDEYHTEIEHIEIIKNGRQARIITTNTESGMLPYDDGSGRPQYMPVNGRSYCEQTLQLSDEQIVMTGANCSTAIEMARY